MEIHGKENLEGPDRVAVFNDLFGGDQLYTFNNCEEKASKKPQELKQEASQKKTAYLDLIAENCKLESIIEQYRLSNDRMKTQIKEMHQGTSQIDTLMDTLVAFFEELKVAEHQNDTKDEKSNQLSLTVLASKISDSLANKESSYLKDCLKEWSGLILSKEARCYQLEKELQTLHKVLEQSRKSQEILELEIKELMKAAQMICDPESDKPVNIYQLKRQLRCKLKGLDDQNEVRINHADIFN